MSTAKFQTYNQYFPYVNNKDLGWQNQQFPYANNKDPDWQTNISQIPTRQIQLANQHIISRVERKTSVSQMVVFPQT